MDIAKVYLITFSPTHTSKRVGEAIVRGTGIKNIVDIDFTLSEQADCNVPREALAVIVVPVYGGKVAPLALKRLEKIQSDGAPTVVVVVYGNRAYEQALIQLDAFVSERGFKVIAGGTFVGEHSYNSEQYPIAPGRPDADDVKFAEEFGEKIMVKVGNAVDDAHLYGVDVSRIQRPSQPIFPMIRFIYTLSKWRKQGMVTPKTPQVDATLCTHCGLCASQCPSGAIVEGDECNTIAEKCIKCCACVKECPQKARTFNTPYAPLISTNFKKRKENRITL